MNIHRVITILILLNLIIPFSTFLFPTELQGKLLKFGAGGVLPAPYVSISLTTKADDEILKTEQTYDNGIYNFNECLPGKYILKIWCKGKDGESLNFIVNILEKPVTYIAPILIHSLQFLYPKEGQTIVSDSEIKVKGTHYNIPDDAFIWIILENRNGNFFLSTYHPILIKQDRTWESKPINIIDGTIKILAVLVTKSDNKTFYLKAKSSNWSHFSKLPKNSYTINTRKINLISSSLFRK